MTYRGYYGKSIQGQMQGVMTRPAVGLNEYNPPTSLNDNFLSDCLDVEPYREEAIKMYAKTASAVNKLVASGSVALAIGTILTGVTDHPIGDDPSIVLLVYNVSLSKYYVRRIDMDDYGIGAFDASALGSGAPGEYSATTFKTEVKNYVVFSHSIYQKLLWFDYSTVGTVTLPFYPRRIFTHASRIFALDTGNKLWWCRAGDFFSWYSMAYDDDALMASTDMANGAYTLTAQPERAGVITFKHTATSTVDTLGTVALVGVYNGASQSETITLVSGMRVQSNKTYDTVTSATQSGHTGAAGADKITIGVGPAGGHVADDAGYWTIENERNLIDFAVISDILFIFSGKRIYAFYGTSQENFNLHPAIIDIGLTKEGDTVSDLVSANNRLYFMSGADVYEFDGQNQPRAISRPIYVNNALTNGVYGGIDMPQSDAMGYSLANYWSLAADKNTLYVYIKDSTLDDGTYRYEFNLKSRTWWKKTVPNHNHASVVGPSFLWYFPNHNKTDTYTVVNSYHTGDYTFEVLDDKGFTHDYNPYLTTKAYNTNPSELGTLTGVILMLSGVANTSADIEVFYSKTTEGDDFVSMYQNSDRLFNGDVEILSINTPAGGINNAHHYRLKIVVSGSALYLYNIERRFRVRGRSR